MAANINEINIHDEENDNCMVCLEFLDNEVKYSLPECGHTFHQNCIMHWFRSGCSKCPLCNNLGVNDPMGRTDNSAWWRGGQYRYSRIRQYARKKDAPKDLKQEISKLKKLEDKLKQLIQEKKELKNSEGNFSVLQKKWNKIRYRKWRLSNTIRRRKMGIANFNIVPIIIAKRITI